MLLYLLSKKVLTWEQIVNGRRAARYFSICLDINPLSMRPINGIWRVQSHDIETCRSNSKDKFHRNRFIVPESIMPKILAYLEHSSKSRAYIAAYSITKQCAKSCFWNASCSHHVALTSVSFSVVVSFTSSQGLPVRWRDLFSQAQPKDCWAGVFNNLPGHTEDFLFENDHLSPKLLLCKPQTASHSCEREEKEYTLSENMRSIIYSCPI